MPQGTLLRCGEGDLLAQRGAAGLAAARCRAARPAPAWASGTRTSSPTTSAARRRRPPAKKRPAERRPVAHRHVALGDGQQAGQPRLGGQQVVEARVELLLGDADSRCGTGGAWRWYRKPKSASRASCLRGHAPARAGVAWHRPRCRHRPGRAPPSAVVARWSARRPAQRVTLRRREHLPRRQQRGEARARRLQRRCVAWRGVNGAEASSRQASATASRWPQKLPLSTVDTRNNE